MITLLLLVRATYTYGVVLHAHPVRGESHNQRNTTGEVATVPYKRRSSVKSGAWLQRFDDVTRVAKTDILR